MITEIEKTLLYIKNNVGLTSRFNLELVPPKMLQVSKNIKNINIFARSASVPSVSGNVYEETFNNIKYWMLIGATTDTINITFYDTKDLIYNTLFRNWLLDATSHETGKALKYYPDDIVGEIRYTINNKTLKLKRITPTNVGDLQTSYDNTDILNFTVTFKVKRIEEA